MQDVTQLTPPQRSFCPKCVRHQQFHRSPVDQVAGHRRWRPAVELEAAMEAALVELAAHYEDRLDEALPRDQRSTWMPARRNRSRGSC